MTGDTVGSQGDHDLRSEGGEPLLELVDRGKDLPPDGVVPEAEEDRLFYLAVWRETGGES